MWLDYHNHHHEFRTFGNDSTAFEAFVDAIGDHLFLELDTGGAATGGEDPAAVLRFLGGGRCSFLHLKGVLLSETGPEASQSSADTGEGDIDLAGCVKVADDIGCEWVVYEDDEPSDPRTAIENGIDVLSDPV